MEYARRPSSLQGAQPVVEHARPPPVPRCCYRPPQLPPHKMVNIHPPLQPLARLEHDDEESKTHNHVQNGNLKTTTYSVQAIHYKHRETRDYLGVIVGRHGLDGGASHTQLMMVPLGVESWRCCFGLVLGRRPGASKRCCGGEVDRGIRNRGLEWWCINRCVWAGR